MKKFHYSLLCLIFTSQIVTAQWYMQQSGTTQQLEDISFIDSNNGLAVDYNLVKL